MAKKTNSTNTRSKGRPRKQDRAGAPNGNKYALKFDTPKARAGLFKAILDHLSDGLSKACFPLCDWDTVEKYMTEFPLEFPADQIKRAIRMGQCEWEKLGKSGARGKIKGFNAKAWEFNMKNRYDWREKTDNIVKNPDGTSLKRSIIILPAKRELPPE